MSSPVQNPPCNRSRGTVTFAHHIDQPLDEQAWRLMEQGRYGEAALLYKEILRTRKRIPGWWNNLGYCYLRLGELETALDCYQTALKLAPRNIDILINTGGCYQRLEQWAEAYRCFYRAWKYQPRDVDLLNNLGVCLVQLERPEEALDYYRQALALAPAEGEIIGNLAAALARCRRWPEAVTCFEKALRLLPEDVSIINNAAACLEALGKCYLAAPLYARPGPEARGATDPAKLCRLFNETGRSGNCPQDSGRVVAPLSGAPPCLATFRNHL